MGNCICKKQDENQIYQIINNVKSNGKSSSKHNQPGYNQYLKNNKINEINKLGNNYFSIPNDHFERVKWVYEYFTNKKDIQNYFKNAPQRINSSIKEITEYLKNYPSRDTLTKYFMIYLWITFNISYDVQGTISNDLIENSPDLIFERGSSTSSGYSLIFDKFCKELKLTSIIINGYGSRESKCEGQKFEKFNHKWNVIDISGKFYFIDSAWGAGNINDNNEFIFNFNPLYFLCPAEFFIENHFPEKSEWQLLENEMTKEKFENSKNYKIIENLNEIFKRKIELISEPCPVIFFNGDKKNNALLINIKYPNKKIFSTLNLLINNNYEKLENMIFIQREFPKISKNNIFDETDAKEKEFINDLYQIILLFPKDGLYKLIIYESENLKTLENEYLNVKNSEIYKNAFEYIIEVNNVSIKRNLGFPHLNFLENNLNYQLNFPKQYYLKKNSMVFFSIVFKEDIADVAIFQGDKYDRLNFNNGVWENTIKIFEDEINLMVKINDKTDFFTSFYSFVSIN